MDIQQDFKELLELFNSNKVEYAIIGAYALAHHGAPRYTGDLDILVGTDKNNAERISDKYGDIPAYYLGLKELVQNKRALGRKKDLADLEALDKIE